METPCDSSEEVGPIPSKRGPLTDKGLDSECLIGVGRQGHYGNSCVSLSESIIRLHYDQKNDQW